MTGPQYKLRSQFSVQTSTESLRMAWIKIALLLFISVEAFGENRIKHDIDDQLQVKQKKKSTNDILNIPPPAGQTSAFSDAPDAQTAVSFFLLLFIMQT